MGGVTIAFSADSQAVSQSVGSENSIKLSKLGQGKPETFNFWGFTHLGGTSHQAGYFVVQRKTIGQRRAAKLKEIKAQRPRRRHESTAETLKWIQAVVRGYFRYHAVPGNEPRRRVFRKDVLRLWLRQLRRRSQRSRWTWERFGEWLAVPIPFACVAHPYPPVRFDAKPPR